MSKSKWKKNSNDRKIRQKMMKVIWLSEYAGVVHKISDKKIQLLFIGFPETGQA
jgi:hypothetical protein